MEGRVVIVEFAESDLPSNMESLQATATLSITPSLSLPIKGQVEVLGQELYNTVFGVSTHNSLPLSIGSRTYLHLPPPLLLKDPLPLSASLRLRTKTT
jgi:hypothetical protein